MSSWTVIELPASQEGLCYKGQVRCSSTTTTTTTTTSSSSSCCNRCSSSSSSCCCSNRCSISSSSSSCSSRCSSSSCSSSCSIFVRSIRNTGHLCTIHLTLLPFNLLTSLHICRIFLLPPNRCLSTFASVFISSGSLPFPIQCLPFSLLIPLT